jgi:hypothetical protein
MRERDCGVCPKCMKVAGDANQLLYEVGGE